MENFVILDGAMGTMLQREGLPMGNNPEIFGLKNPNKLLKIQKAICKFKNFDKTNN